MSTAASSAHEAGRHIRRYARQRSWCEWEDFDTWLPRIHADLDNPHAAVWPPFHLLSLPGMDAAGQRRCADRWLTRRMAETADARQAARGTLDATRARTAAEPLRIGYLSGDFHQHATALLLIESLEAHDPRRFELHAYSHGPASDGEMRHRLQAAFAGFHDISGMGDEQAARQIHADGIDILVDLKGYTASSRSMLLAWRPAPVLVSFLGYPGTLGGAHADYLISDRRVTPQSASADYSEALACLPHSYQPHARHVPAQTAPTRADCGLPEAGVVLCCFNQPWKFSPEIFDVWCRILRRVPDSVLWLLDDECARGNLRQEVFARGIDPQRLVFAPDAAQPEHLARVPLADLMLDTWPYNAHTTASDALGAGVPLVTLRGDTFAGRVAESLLHAVGLTGLVTDSSQAYEDLAVALATDPARLHTLRARLGELLPAAALFDVPAYTRDLESLYDRMWARHQTGLPPQAIDLNPTATP